MDVLEHPTFAVIRLLFEVGGTQGGSAGSSLGCPMEKAEVRGLELLEHAGDGCLKSRLRRSTFYREAVAGHCVFPLGTEEFRLVELFLECVEHLFQDIVL